MSTFRMQVEKVEEAGYTAALLGLSYNKKKTVDEMNRVAEKLAFHDGGHNKFLESIVLWLSVQAPRYWWQEADTFRLSTKQSESTMHTLKQELQAVDMADEDAVNNYLQTNFETDACDKFLLEKIRHALAAEDLVAVKKLLPEGFLQRRLWCMSYKTLRNIVHQRKTHRLPHWQSFIQQVLEQVDHPELLPSLADKKAD